MRARRRDLALLALGGAHLAFVANAITGLVGFGGSPALAAGFYGNVTGAETGYTFFAPRVPFEITPTVRLLNARGGVLPSLPAGSQEERFREASLGLYFMQQESSGLAAAALAADALRRSPQARSVVVSFKIHNIPTMEAYRRGDRPTDELVYEGEFARNDGA